MTFEKNTENRAPCFSGAFYRIHPIDSLYADD